MTRKKDNKALATQKTLELKKHVGVIHSSNKLSLLQRKIANALLFNAYSELQSKDEHTIHIANLCELIGYDSHDHKTIKRALVNLLSTVLEWNLLDGEPDAEGVWNASSIIADASIDGALCTYSYSNKMRKLLHHPTMYGRLDMIVQAKFQSGYGLALYENCSRFQDIGQTPWLNLAKFRKLMGVADSKYKIFRDFKMRVLDKAVEEVNQYSPLEIQLQLRKENRQVTFIQFLIKKKTAIAVNHVNSPLIDLLRSEFGFSIKQINQIIALHNEKYIREKIELVQTSASFKDGKVKNLARYLLSALRDNYQPAKTNRSTNNYSHAADKYEREKKLREDQLEMSQFMRYQNKKLLSLFAQLSASEQTSLTHHFEKFLGTSMYKDIFVRSGLENVLIQDQLCTYLRQINHDLLMQLPTREIWLQEIFNK